jgi:hypothetical protein
MLEIFLHFQFNIFDFTLIVLCRIEGRKSWKILLLHTISPTGVLNCKLHIMFHIHSYNTIIHSFIIHHLPRPVFLYLHRFSAQKPPRGGELRIELGPAHGGPALQQADALWTEPRRTLRVRRSMFTQPEKGRRPGTWRNRSFACQSWPADCGGLRSFFLHVVLPREKLKARWSALIFVLPSFAGGEGRVSVSWWKL